MFALRQPHSTSPFWPVLLAFCLALLPPCARAQPTTSTSPSASQETLKEVQWASDRFERGAPVPDWVQRQTSIPEVRSKGAVVVRLADTQFLVASTPATFLHRAWAVHDSASLEQLGHYGIGFQANFQQVRLHSLQIRRNGTVLDQTRTAKIRFLQREAGLEQGLYNGEVTASILVDDLRVGDTLELAYTLEGSNPVMGNKFVDVAAWDSTIPVELRRVTLLHPTDRPIQWRVLGDLNSNIEKPQESVAKGMHRLVWQEQSLAPVEYEPYVPSAFAVARILHFSEFSSWGEVSDWARQLFQSPIDSPPLAGELQQVAQRLRSMATPEERVSAALSWVQSEIRYFSVSLGESSHRPHQPAETLARRYGDCKDKSFLLIELLRALDVPAQPVLVSTRTRVGPGKALPSPYAFDHAIVHVRLGGKSHFLDPTLQGQSGRLERMGQIHEGSQVLVVQPGTQGLTTITTDNFAERTRNELREKLSLPKLGSDGVLEVRRLWSGASAEVARLAVARMPKEQYERALIEPYENRYPGIRRETDSVIEDDADNNVLTLMSKYVAPKLAISSGGEWGVPYAANNMQNMLRLPPSAHRTQPMDLPSLPRTLQYSIEVAFPPEVAVLSDPQTRTVRDPAFEYSASSSFRGNRASAAMTLTILQGEVEAKNTATYMEALRQTSALSSPFFHVRRDDIKPTGLLGLGPRTLQQSIKERLNERIDKLSKSIDSGKLNGEDLANAYCDRADAYGDLGQGALALKEAQLAVKTAPNLSSAYNCRGSAWFLLGDYPRSIADHSKAITLGGAQSMPFYRRGLARFYSGQYALALSDFTQARDPDNPLYAELWRVWTQKRLGMAPDGDQQKLAAANPRGDWPCAALAMLHGLLPVQEVLDQIERKQGDEKEMALAEAYFYIGQHYLSQGDKAHAIDYFKKTRAQGITIYVEHIGAGIELQQLGVTAQP